ncbi:MAG: hypothetical protein GAK40_01429 [Burkholderia plantarii]|nr:MAG: hypothetical protein GAK40_01429 [Burkholderia plantarii]
MSTVRSADRPCRATISKPAVVRNGPGSAAHTFSVCGGSSVFSASNAMHGTDR